LRENQILIPDWTYFHCPGATLLSNQKIDRIGSEMFLAKCIW